VIEQSSSQVSWGPRLRRKRKKRVTEDYQHRIYNWDIRRLAFVCHQTRNCVWYLLCVISARVRINSLVKSGESTIYSCRVNTKHVTIFIFVFWIKSDVLKDEWKKLILFWTEIHAYKIINTNIITLLPTGSLNNYMEPLILWQLADKNTSSQVTAKNNFLNYTPSTLAQIIITTNDLPLSLHVSFLMQELLKLTKSDTHHTDTKCSRSRFTFPIS
jgi:hypothetical protein